MSGIASDKTTTFRERIDRTRMHVIDREPIHLFDIELDAHVALDLFLDLFVWNSGLVLVMSFREGADDPPAVLALERKECRQRILAKIDLKRVVAVRPFELDIRNIEQTLDRITLEGQTEFVTHGTLCSVARNYISRLNRKDRTVGTAHIGRNCFTIIC